MTETPDSGLTDLIAAHKIQLFGVDGPHYQAETEYDGCLCGWQGAEEDHPAHVALVVEQHTNGRIAELGWDELVAAIPDGWELQESAHLEEVSRVRQRDLEASQATTARWRARAEKAEATIASVHEIRCGNCGNPLSEGSGNCVSDAGRPHIYDEADLRAALEGEQQ